MPQPYKIRLYQLTFIAAGLYNMAFGLWATLCPHSFFDLFHMDAPRYPAIWQCLGMVVGLYGILYIYSAFRLDRAFTIIFIGLLGKILGPIGLIPTIYSGEWPSETFTLIVFNDLIWWMPFTLFLLERTKISVRIKELAPYFCAGFNGIAAVFLLIYLRGGTEVIDNPLDRITHITNNLISWRIGWGLWMLSAVSLLGFYAWWGSKIANKRIAIVACALTFIGNCCDLLGESLYIAWVPQHFGEVSPLVTLLTAGYANGLYTISGILLTLATPMLRGFLLAWTWLIWVFGIIMTIMAFVGSVFGLVISTAVLMTLFVPWVIYFSWRLKCAA